MKKTTLLLVLLILVNTVWSNCNLPIGEQKFEFLNCTTYFLDETQTLLPEALTTVTFSPYQKALAINNTTNLWLHWKSNIKPKQYYELNAGHVAQVVVYAKINGQYQQISQNGFLFSPTERADQYDMNSVIFALPTPSSSLLFKFSVFNAYNYPYIVRPTLQPFQPATIKTHRNRSFWYGITLGSILAFLLYPLSLLRLERRTYYMYYLAFIVFCFLYSLLDTEQYTGIDVLFSYYPVSFKYLVSLFSSLSIVFYILFFKSFLRLSERLPKLNRLLKFLVNGLTISIVLDMLLHSIDYPTVAFYQSLSVRGLAFIIGVYSIWLVSILKNRQANYIIAGTAFWLTGTLIFIISSVFQARGFAVEKLWITPQYFLQAGTIIELCFFSIALSFDRRLYYEDKVRAEEAVSYAQQLQIQQQRFFNNITHEFRTPLTIIQGITGEIKAHTKEKKLIQRSSAQLLHLVNQLLELAKLEVGQSKLNYIQADIIAYLKYLTESFQSLAWSQQRSLSIHVNPESLMMDYEPEKLQIVISNLFANAFKFTPRYGRIIMSVQQLNLQQLEIKIEDNGIGINAEQLPNIFDRFFQAADKSQRQIGGTGIGLALVKELVEQMKGSISVESQPHERTVFTIQLPITQNATIKHLTTNPSNVLTSTIFPPLAAENTIIHSNTLPQLLIVEDNQDVITFLISVLQSDYQIITAMDGQDGIEQARANLPDIIISDVMMPEMDGFAFCKRLKEDVRTSHIPIILLTAKVSQEDKLTGLKEGADAYLTKPFQKQELFVRLDQLLQNRERLQHYYAQHAELPPQLPLENEFLKMVTQHIQQNLDNENYSVVDLADAVHFDRVHLFRKLKDLIGIAPKQLIIKMRMEQARELLLTTQHNIGEVARQVGYRDGGNFAKAYKKYYGEPPSKTRDKQ